MRIANFIFRDLSSHVVDKKVSKGVGIGKTIKGLICAFVWPFLMASSKICVQALDNKIQHLTLNGSRYLVSAIGYGFYYMITQRNPIVNRGDMKALIVYCIVLNLATITAYVPVTYIPLTSVESVYMCSVLLTAALTFGLLIKSLRHVTKKVEIVASLSSGAGVCLVIQPWQDNFNPNLKAILLGYGVSVLGGVLWTTEAIVICWYPFLQNQNNQIKTLFWNCITGSILCLSIAFSVEDFNVNNLGWPDWLYTAGHCATFGILQVTYMYACSVIAGTLNLVIGTTNAVYVIIAQYTFLSGKHPGNRNWIEILGVILVVISSTVPAYMRAKHKGNTNEDNTPNIEESTCEVTKL